MVDKKSTGQPGMVSDQDYSAAESRLFRFVNQRISERFGNKSPDKLYPGQKPSIARSAINTFFNNPKNKTDVQNLLRLNKSDKGDTISLYEKNFEDKFRNERRSLLKRDR
jgi:hypothetical protein